MAKREDDPTPDDEEDGDEPEGSNDDAPVATEERGGALAVDVKAPADLATAEKAALAPGEAGDGEAEEEQAAAQLGIDRYVLAGFFAAGLVGAYVVGRLLYAVWESIANKDWFNQSLPTLAAVSDEGKSSYCFAFAGLVALAVVWQTYRRPDVRSWCDDVAGELAKVKWPSKKEVYNSTFIVIVASAAATLYLALLDRLWAFVTNIVYGGDGS